jgi:hypothetical protein
MPEVKLMETQILATLSAQAGELTFTELADLLHARSGVSDDALIRMALWPLIARDQITLSESLGLMAVRA